jgi:hypothetical protein
VRTAIRYLATFVLVVGTYVAIIVVLMTFVNAGFLRVSLVVLASLSFIVGVSFTRRMLRHL